MPKRTPRIDRFLPGDQMFQIAQGLMSAQGGCSMEGTWANVPRWIMSSRPMKSSDTYPNKMDSITPLPRGVVE